MDATYERVCMENTKEDYCSEIYDTLTNYNDRNHTPISNVDTREVIYQVIMEEKAEANNVTVDTFSSQ